MRFDRESPKILHLVAGSLQGGAGKGAYGLHLALLNKGLRSKILTDEPNVGQYREVVSVSNGIRSKILSKIRPRIDQSVTKLYENKSQIFSPGFIGYNFKDHDLFDESDILHLHWVCNGFVNLKHLSNLGKPVIWTVRDMWPFTGGCHYSMDCTRYKIGCGNCPMLGSNRDIDLSRIAMRRKKKYLDRSICFVGISSWVSNCIKESYIYGGHRVTSVPNSINVGEYLPIEKKLARGLLNINEEKFVVLAGAQNMKDLYKGFDLYQKALLSVKDKGEIILLFFGAIEHSQIDQLPFEVMNLGYLNDAISLRLAYSAADIFVAPSRLEAFGKTLVEAMACQTPVVCFDSSGPKEIVEHMVTGYKAIPFDTDDLANGISYLKKNSSLRKKMGRNAERRAAAKFDTSVSAKQYLELYNELLNT